MPDTYVKLPDGSWAQFPEGTKDADIKSALQSFVAKPSTPVTPKPSQPVQPAPSRSTTGAAPLDAAVGFVGGLAHQILDPAVQASRALLPSGAGVEAGVERLGLGTRALTENDLYKKATYIPDTTAGTLGAYLPVIAGAATGVATEGAVPTALTLGGALLGQKAAEAGAGYIAEQPAFALTPDQIEAWRGLAGTAGMVAGGAGAHRIAPKVTVPQAMQAVRNVPSAVSESAKQRSAASVVMGRRGYKAAGYPGLVSGAVAGALKPELVNLSENTLLDIAKGKTATAPKTTPSKIASARQHDIDAGLKAAQDTQAQARLRQQELDDHQKTFENAISAHVAEGTEVPAVLTEQLQRVNRELGRAKLPETEAKVNELMEVYGPNGVAGRVDLVTDAASKKDYAAIQKHLASYVDAEEQPPTALVELFDRLREHRIAASKSVSAEAYDVATAQLVDAAAQGPQAYKQALAAIPKQTRALLQNVDASLLSTLESRSRNAGGRLGKPADDPWFTLMNDVLGEWARPQSVEVPVESPGGSATWSSGVEVIRDPNTGSAISVDAAAPATTSATASATAEPAAIPANSAEARALRRGNPVFSRSKPGMSASTLADAKALQAMAAIYEQHGGVVGGVIDDSFLARFKTLAYRFMGEEGRKKFTFSTRSETPSLSTLNGYISNSYEFKNLPRSTKERLGISVAKD